MCWPGVETGRGVRWWWREAEGNCVLSNVALDPSLQTYGSLKWKLPVHSQRPAASAAGWSRAPAPPRRRSLQGKSPGSQRGSGRSTPACSPEPRRNDVFSLQPPGGPPPRSSACGRPCGNPFRAPSCSALPTPSGQMAKDKLLPPLPRCHLF